MFIIDLPSEAVCCIEEILGLSGRLFAELEHIRF